MNITREQYDKVNAWAKDRLTATGQDQSISMGKDIVRDLFEQGIGKKPMRFGSSYFDLETCTVYCHFKSGFGEGIDLATEKYLSVIEGLVEALESIDGHTLRKTSPMREEQRRKALTLAAPYLPAKKGDSEQQIKQEEVAENKIKDILEDGLLWIKEMREGVNKWSEGHCGLDYRMQNLEEWGKEVRVLLYQCYRITKRGEK